jgi:hypothetical protein
LTFTGHQEQGFIFVLPRVRPALDLTASPTTVEPKDALGIKDYWLKSCIPIQYIETLSHLFWVRRTR